MNFSSRAYLILVLFLSVCSPSAKETDCESDECLKQIAYDKVISVHDEVMPKLSYVSELKGKIEERIGSTQDSVRRVSLFNQMEALDAADEAMFDWMHNFNSEIDNMPIKEALDYLATEQEKVEAMADQVTSTIKRAEDSLNRFSYTKYNFT